MNKSDSYQLTFGKKILKRVFVRKLRYRFQHYPPANEDNYLESSSKTIAQKLANGVHILLLRSISGKLGYTYAHVYIYIHKCILRVCILLAQR